LSPSRPCSREDALVILGHRLEELPRRVSETRRLPLGIFRGLRFGMVLHPHFPPDVYLEGALTRQTTLSRDHQGPRAVVNALERLAGGYASEGARVRQDFAIAENQLRDYRARLGQPFPHDGYLSELTTLRDQLKIGLSGATPEPGAEPGLTVSELADRIKALKAAHTIEATPQRTGQRRSTAEEPVTARIRRHTEALPASEPEATLPAEAESQVDRNADPVVQEARPEQVTENPKREPIPPQTEPETTAMAEIAGFRQVTGPHSARVLADDNGQEASPPARSKPRQRFLF
jgi:hypothetical protein